jgi:hypothetical protein
MALDASLSSLRFSFLLLIDCRLPTFLRGVLHTMANQQRVVFVWTLIVFV